MRPILYSESSGYSLSHGAGRKWARSVCKSRIYDLYDRDSIRETKLKSRVVCHDTELLYQEAPEAYKNIETVIESLLAFGLIEVVATLRPILTYNAFKSTILFIKFALNDMLDHRINLTANTLPYAFINSSNNAVIERF